MKQEGCALLGAAIIVHFIRRQFVHCRLSNPAGGKSMEESQVGNVVFVWQVLFGSSAG